ncbi:sodium:solute symporter family protein [Brevibacterium album]|uniref:sodium:solute symporter family protein n=1 Tax=Brevibacterium album TaxID=417948 RepID=UPI0004293FAB|nr:sodium:solute symporter family protein [Brevibacterium album]
MNVGITLMIGLASLIVIGLGALISFLVSRRHKSEADWMVGGRSLPVYVLAFTQYATAVGGGVLVAHVGIAYSWGFSVFWYEAFVVVGMLIIALFANWLRRRRFATIPEVFTRLYGQHKVLLTVTAVSVIIVPFGWLATQFVAFANLFSEVTGVPFAPLIIVMALISLLFVLPGGLTSVAWSDFFFGVFMIVASVVVAGYAVWMAGGWGSIAAQVPDELFAMPEGLAAAGWTTILLWLFAILPGTLTNQLYYQRVFAAKSGKEARTGIYLSAVMVMVAGGYALLIGLAVRAMHPDLGVDGREGAAGWFLAQVPVWLLAVYGAFLMATIVSTTGSALQSVVANMISDLRNAYVTRETSERTRISLSRWCTVGVTLVAAVLAIVYPEALGWLVATYAYSASLLAVPLLLGIVMSRRYRVRTPVAYASMIAGVIGCAGAHVLGTEVPYAVFGICASLAGYLLALLFVRPVRMPGGAVPEVPEDASGAAFEESPGAAPAGEPRP